jgi:hypothetical protein
VKLLDFIPQLLHFANRVIAFHRRCRLAHMILKGSEKMRVEKIGKKDE